MFSIGTGRICPRCGRSNVGFVGVLCSDCYVEVYGVASVPGSLDFTYCKICGSYKLQGQWVEGSGGLEDTV
ncbi:MAG: NMD3-related protein, partial [Acidilobaceae archaeon]